MDAQQLRDRIAALVAQYDAELLPPEPPAEILVSSDLQAALDSAPAGSTLRLVDESTFRGNFLIHTPMRLVSNLATIESDGNGSALSITADDVSISGPLVMAPEGAVTNDLVVIAEGAHRTHLDSMTIQGNGATKRGISAQGFDMTFDGVNVLRIGRVGQESQAMACWNGTGITARHCIFEAGSTPFLAGGASPAVPNHVPADLLFEDCLFTHPPEWRGRGYVCKTGFELKSGRRVTVRNCTIENVWVDAQTGFAITLTPSQYGNSPENIVEDVLFDGNTIRNVGCGANILGFSQHQATRPTLRSHGLRFLNNTITISRATYGGHGALQQLGGQPADILWDNNTVTTDGASFVMTSDSGPVAGFVFTHNSVVVAGTYGVWTPIGSRGVGFAQVFPGGQITDNQLVGAHAVFKTSFPQNTWL